MIFRIQFIVVIAAALVAADGPSAIRGQIDRFVQFEFRLYEPDSPVGNWLRERGITSRLAQSSVIIEEYLAQQREMTLDLREVAKATRDLPDGTAPTAAEFAASRARQVPSTKIPKDDCATITKLPPDELGECYMEGDRIKVTHKKASAN